MEERYIQAVRIDWDEVPPSSWLRAVPALQGLETLSFHRNITFFAGENGTGKSTLLEAIAVAYGFNPEGGTVNYRFSTFDEVAGLGRAVRLVKGFRHAPFGYFFRAESFFNVASRAEVYRNSGLGPVAKEDYYRHYGGKALHEQSHGESFLNWFSACEDAGVY